MFVCCLIAGRFVGNWRSCGVFAWKKAVSNLYIRHSGAIPFVYGRWHRRSYEWLENCVLTATLSSFSLQFDQLHAFSYKGIFLNAACSWIQTHTIGWCTGLCECYDCRIATINYSICIFWYHSKELSWAFGQHSKPAYIMVECCTERLVWNFSNSAGKKSNCPGCIEYWEAENQSSHCINYLCLSLSLCVCMCVCMCVCVFWAPIDLHEPLNNPHLLTFSLHQMCFALPACQSIICS